MQPTTTRILSDVKATLYNRILLVLAFAGLFIAGTLSLSKLLKISIPCGPAHGCDIVNNHPSSIWFGIPVAYIGFGAYFVLAVLAVVRGLKGVAETRKLATLGFLIAIGGALMSIGLQFYSFTVIHAVCTYCFASAVTMVLTAGFYAALMQSLDSVESTPETRSSTTPDLFMSVGLALLLAMGLTAQGFIAKKSGASWEVIPTAVVDKVDMVPAKPNIYGEANAPITIIEFADMMCPSCQSNSPKLKEFVRQHPGKVRVIYRHFPLERLHPLGPLAAFIGEYAAEKGKFWEFTLAIMATHKNMEETNDVFNIAQQVGLDTTNIKARAGNDNDPIYERLTSDKNAANSLGVKGTPTFCVMVKGQPTQAFSYDSLMEALATPPYVTVIDGK